MKIGVMLRNLKELGGIKVYTLNLLMNLFMLDSANEYVLFYKDKGSVGTFSKCKNVKERLLDFPTKLLWDQVAVPMAVKKEKIDVILNPKLSIPLMTKAKTILVLHGMEQFAVSEVFPFMDRFYTKIMMPLFCRRADAVISTTKMGVEEMNKYLGIEKNKIHPIHEAHKKRFKVLDKAQCERVRVKYNLPEKFLLFVGGLNPLKNFSGIIKAYQQLKDKIPHQLIAVGFKRWHYEDDLRLVEELGLSKDVRLMGFIPDEDLPAFYNLADVFVFPSLYEGFGIPVLEAMASGCPVITTKTGCSPEVAGGAAVLVDPRNVQEIADAIYQVIHDQKLRARLIKDGLGNAAKFSWEKTALETLLLFRKVTSDPGKPLLKEAKLNTSTVQSGHYDRPY
jgi:glycosyltransferase involved in cell wall biosynthesis